MTYIQPLILLFSAMALIGLVRHRRCEGALLPMVGTLALLLLAWHPVAWVLSRPLEARYPVRPPQSTGARAIVVLSSSVDPPHFERPYPLPDQETYRRCETAAWLFRQAEPVPVLVSGGLGPGIEQPYSATMSELLQRAGVPKSMIWIEQRSRSTHENAVYTAEILRKHDVSRIVLIVDAQSMPRAAACFRKEGIDVIPAPSSFIEFGPLADDLIPSWRGIRDNEITLHESVGLMWYWLRGWI
jgi:uncharacterized SAM-binding protein YcdF (DUF218 family)